jgi:hypothetical protein
MKGSKNVEVYQVSHTVTESDHEAGKYTRVPVGDTVVLVVERETTVVETVASVLLNGVIYEEEVVEEKEEKPKRTKKA